MANDQRCIQLSKEGLRVEAKLPNQPSDGTGESYQAVNRIACKGIHYINPKTAQTLSSLEKQQQGNATDTESPAKK